MRGTTDPLSDPILKPHTIGKGAGKDIRKGLGKGPTQSKSPKFDHSNSLKLDPSISPKWKLESEFFRGAMRAARGEMRVVSGSEKLCFVR
jgi:hypothetical protein